MFTALKGVITIVSKKGAIINFETGLRSCLLFNNLMTSS
jgi:hypothetical protein